jgi:hypothetical protein
MSKFLLNLLMQISKALVNSKIQFLIQKFFFFVFGLANRTTPSAFSPAGPTGPSPLVGQSHPCWPIWPVRRWRLHGSTFSLFELVASLSSLCQVGPGCQLRLPPPPTDRCRFFSSPSATPRRPASNLEMPGEVFTPRLDFPR